MWQWWTMFHRARMLLFELKTNCSCTVEKSVWFSGSVLWSVKAGPTGSLVPLTEDWWERRKWAVSNVGQRKCAAVHRKADLGSVLSFPSFSAVILHKTLQLILGQWEKCCQTHSWLLLRESSPSTRHSDGRARGPGECGEGAASLPRSLAPSFLPPLPSHR